MISLMKVFRRQARALNSFARVMSTRIVIPSLCRSNNGVWQNIASGRPIEATVVGWRVP